MERIGEGVRQELGRFGPALGMAEVVVAWPEAVGSAIAANAWPARIGRDGTLRVHTSDSVWAFELGQQAPTILDRLRELLGESVPKALRFVPGAVPEAVVPEESQGSTAAVEPGPEALRKAAQLVAAIESEELRERVGRAVALSLARASSDQPFW